MERDERWRADALDRYWDGVLRGETPDRPPEVGETVAAAIGSLRTRRNPSHLDPARERVWADLLTKIDGETQEGKEPTLNAAVPDAAGPIVGANSRAVPLPNFFRRLRHNLTTTSVSPRPAQHDLPPALSPNGHLSRLAIPPGPHTDLRRVRPFAHLATAGLLVVTLVSTLVVFALLRPDRDGGGPNGGDLTAITASTMDQVLIDITLSPDDLPDPANIVLWRRRLEPGQQAVVANDKWGTVEGVAAEYVLSGQLRLSIEAPFRVVRAGLGQVEEVSAATEVLLGPGDLAIYAFDQRRDYLNPGSEPTELLLAAIHETHSILPMVIPGYHGPNYQNYELPAAIRAGEPVPLTVRRLTLSPGTPTPETARWGAEGMQLSWAEPPGPATPTRIESERMVYVLTLGQVPV